MKTRTKVALAVLCALLLVTVSILGTMAYLTSTTTKVTNTFTYGNVAITLDEATVTEYGVKDGDTRVTENTYKLIPGHKYVKDPTIHVDSESESCYVFAKVEDGLVNIEADDTIATQMTNNGWVSIGENVYCKEDPVAAGDDVVVFEYFKLKPDAKVEDYGEAQISVTGYAVQADGFDTAQAAWSATFATNA